METKGQCKLQLLINSDDRDSTLSTSSSNYLVNLPISINRGQEFKRVTLKNCNIPLATYNVRLGVNDQIVWNRGGDFVYTVPPGAYTATALATQIQAGMNGVDANGYVVTYSATTFKITITGIAVFSLNWVTNANQGRDIDYQIGFNQVDTAALTSHTGNNVINLHYPKNILIAIDEFGQVGQTAASSQNYTFIIPVLDKDGGEVGNFREMQFFEQTTNLFTGNIGSLRVRLTDENGAPLDLNGADWTFVVEFW